MLIEKRRAYLELHIAVLLFGFTAILGDLIQLTALVLVWWRVFLTSASLFPFSNPFSLWKDLGKVMFWRFAGIGVLVALHWLTFYGAIKWANASICLICMATTSFFTSFLEPIVVKKSFQWHEMLIGILIIPGMVLIVNNIEEGMMIGVFCGLMSAFLAAVFSTFNKKYIKENNPMRITFLELSSAWVFLSIVLVIMYANGSDFGAFWPVGDCDPNTLLQVFNLQIPITSWRCDWLYLIVLALLCTSLAYTLSLRALRHISAFSANLTVNLEPVYGIFFAWILLNENDDVDPGFYWGVAIILIAVFSYPLLQKVKRYKSVD